MNKTKAVIIDLDGTLANNIHRVHFVNKYDVTTIKDWDSFYAGIPKDYPNPWCKELVKMYWQNGYEIIFVTGRPEKFRKQTEAWLLEHVSFYPKSYLLFMRENNCYAKDYKIKKKIYEQNIEGKYQVDFVLEDRKSVVDMYRKLGITVLQCAEGNY